MMKTAAFSGPSIDELRLFLVRKSITTVGIAACEHEGRGAPAHLLAEACARSNMRTLFIDFSEAASTEPLPIWGQADTTKPDTANNFSGSHRPFKHMKGGSDQCALYGNPSDLRHAFARTKLDFDMVICATDPVVGPRTRPAHLSILTACDGVILRAVAGMDTTDRIEAAAHSLRAIGATTIGCVFDASLAPPPTIELSRWIHRRLAMFSRIVSVRREA
jgi:hypothetical protein